MKKKWNHFIIGGLICIFSTASAQTVGLLQHDLGSLDDGYVLFGPVNDEAIYLIDKCGRQVHSWLSNYESRSLINFMPDGNIYRAGFLNNPSFVVGGSGGIIEKIDWNSNVLWSYKISDTGQCQHHDIRALPNGNVLVLAWDKKTPAEAIQAGRNPNLLGSSIWSEKIVELQPVGIDSAVIVWEWRVWDHLVQYIDSTKDNYFPPGSSNPGLMNINYKATTSTDWLHFNSIDYNPTFDQILISNHNFNEIFIIDHSTTTAEAASHNGGNFNKGGDLLYRWGNPASYGAGANTDIKLSEQHNAHWIENGLPNAGKIMIFNNKKNPLVQAGGSFYSSVEIIDSPVDSSGAYTLTLPYAPASFFWTYSDSGNFYAPHISGAQQLSNGNVLICDGPSGIFFEIDSLKNKVWRYKNPVGSNGPVAQGSNPVGNIVFRSNFYSTAYSGFTGHSLIPASPIELNPNPDTCLITNLYENSVTGNKISIYPNPITDYLHIVSDNESEKIKSVEIINSLGQVMLNTTQTSIDLSGVIKGIYLIKIVTVGGSKITKRVIKN